MEQKIQNLIEDTINNLGYDLVRIMIHGTTYKIVEIMIEKKSGESVKLEDCQIVNRSVSTILDVEDILKGKYFLEISSPGIERPLVKLSDYDKFSGKEIKIRLKKSVNDKLTYKGILIGVKDDFIQLKSKDVVLDFNYDNIKKSNLVMTDEMFRKSLNKK